MVAVGYEQARGLRQKNQSAQGFQVTSSKTVAVPVARLYTELFSLLTFFRWNLLRVGLFEMSEAHLALILLREEDEGEDGD